MNNQKNQIIYNEASINQAIEELKLCQKQTAVIKENIIKEITKIKQAKVFSKIEEINQSININLPIQQLNEREMEIQSILEELYEIQHTIKKLYKTENETSKKKTYFKTISTTDISAIGGLVAAGIAGISSQLSEEKEREEEETKEEKKNNEIA